MMTKLVWLSVDEDACGDRRMASCGNHDTTLGIRGRWCIARDRFRTTGAGVRDQVTAMFSIAIKGHQYAAYGGQSHGAALRQAVITRLVAMNDRPVENHASISLIVGSLSAEATHRSAWALPFSQGYGGKADAGGYQHQQQFRLPDRFILPGMAPVQTINL